LAVNQDGPNEQGQYALNAGLRQWKKWVKKGKLYSFIFAHSEVNFELYGAK